MSCEKSDRRKAAGVIPVGGTVREGAETDRDGEKWTDSRDS